MNVLGAVTRVAGWVLPWIVLLAISASAAYGMTTALAGADALPAAPPPVAVSGPTCDTSDNPMPAYAVSTHRVPATAC